ncbi:MAG: PIG-L family deacetylase, partial [Chloroflexota bacterium]
HDSGMENSADNDNPDCLFQAPVEDVAAQITRLIREIKPQVIITFDPTGGYFHPDHIHMHKATTAAFQAAGDPTRYPDQIEEGLHPYQPQKLYYTVFPRGLIKAAVAILPFFGKDPKAFGKNKDINLKRIADIEQDIHTKIWTAPFFDEAQKAADCHASQLSGLSVTIPNFIRKWFARYNAYTRIFPKPGGNEPIEDDLFMGVNFS